MSLMDVSELPPIITPEEFDGGDRRWSVWCSYHDRIEDEAQVATINALKMTNTIAAFVLKFDSEAMAGIGEESDQLLILRAKGFMDQAVADAALSLRGIQHIIHSPLRKVEMTNIDTTPEPESLTVFDVTHTIKAALGEPLDEL